MKGKTFMESKKIAYLIAIQCINIVTTLGAFQVIPLIGESFIYISAIIGLFVISGWKGNLTKYKHKMQAMMGVLAAIGLILSCHDFSVIVPGMVSVVSHMLITIIAIVTLMPQEKTNE